MTNSAILVRLLAVFLVWLVVVNYSDAAVTKGISPQERQALQALYENTNGAGWKDHSGWLGPTGSECEWHGVICQSSTMEGEQVVSLDLSDDNLQGKIPDALAGLGNLDTKRVTERPHNLW